MYKDISVISNQKDSKKQNFQFGLLVDLAVPKSFVLVIVFLSLREEVHVKSLSSSLAKCSVQNKGEAISFTQRITEIVLDSSLTNSHIKVFHKNKQIKKRNDSPM